MRLGLADLRRTTSWVLMGLVAAAILLAGAPPATASSHVYDLVFPVAGENTYTDTWGAARSNGRTHTGTDILADKMTPIVAVADGYVGWMHDDIGGNCCAMEIQHDDGWRSWYIHMNNDTPGTDDGLAWGFAEGIERGARVEAGDLIGWVGDSGNAEWTVSHLHFELHDPNGTKVNPYEALLSAQSAIGPFPSASAFVNQQYLDFLAREAEPAGAAAWTNAIESGSLTPEEVIDQFMGSEEFELRIAPVARLYFATFLRIPDYEGLFTWVNASNNGWSLVAIADEFTTSEEFQLRYGELSDAEYVALIYENVLGREPDADGLADWVSRLEDGQSRGAILVGFSESPEYRANSQNEVVVTMAYLGMLRRAPEQAGFDHWVALMDGGMNRIELIREVFSSEEYANRFP